MDPPATTETSAPVPSRLESAVELASEAVAGAEGISQQAAESGYIGGASAKSLPARETNMAVNRAYGGAMADGLADADELQTAGAGVQQLDAPPLPSARANRAPPVSFRYYVDEISDTKISGWVIRLDRPTEPCIVAIKENGEVLARATASRFREDLVNAGVGDGCHAFLLPTPHRMLDGESHTIDVVEQETGLSLTGGPIPWQAGLAGPVLGTPHSNAGRVSQLFNLGRQPEADASRLSARANLRPSALAPTDERGAALRSRAQAQPSAGTRLLFDISDLVYYIGHHANLTGIQRVQSSIVLAVLANNVLPRNQLTFLSYNGRTQNWVAIPTGFLEALLKDLFLPETQRVVSYPAEEACYGLLPGARDFDGVGELDDGNPSVLCLLGAAWVNQDYIHRVLALKRRFGTRFVMTVHDLIPIYARETCDQDTARVFEAFMQRALRHVDHILSVSENTARDIMRYTSALQIRQPPVTVTRNGSSFAEFLPSTPSLGDLQAADIPPRFVLFVATIEGRKNHQLMLDVWQRMIAAGDDPPHLVCVGRLGWKSSNFISTLVETNYLDGKVLLLRDICDADLRLLYNRCMFTVCPTFYEGWGLPVGESLALGKICVCSDRASIPEVAGEYGVYIDIDDTAKSLEVVRNLIRDDAARRRLETKIRRGYAPVTWHSVAKAVVDACQAVTKTEWQDPYPFTAIPYSSEISFARLDRDVDGTGEMVLSRIAGARKGLFLSDPLDAQSFLRGEEARSNGFWAAPEDWGTWACQDGAELALALPSDSSQVYYLFLRLRASGPVSEQPVRISGNGEVLWSDSIGQRPRNLVFRVRPKIVGDAGWRLRLQAQINLPPDLRSQIAAIDSRVPTIGFERLIVVPENDLKTRLDILYTLLL